MVAPPSPGQSLTVEYVVTGTLDGTTPAPPITRQGSDDLSATEFDPENQIYRVEVENLGLIDPDLGTGGSIGPRCIPFFWIGTDELGDLDAATELVAALPDGTYRLQKNVSGSLAGQPGVYLDTGFAVAQGSSIRVVGFAASSPNDPIRVRVSIEVPDDCGDFALGVIADKLSGGGGGGAALCNANPTPIVGGQSASPGNAQDASRCDHRHAVPVGDPVTVVGPANDPGDSPELARANHQHRLELIGQEDGSEVGRRPILNVTGGGASLSDDGAGDRLILDVPGVGAPLQTRSFTDDQTVDLVVGSQASDAFVHVDLALSNADGDVTVYELTLAVSATGVDLDCPQTDSDSPLLTVEPQAVVSGGQVIVRLVGSGPGTATAAAYRVIDTLPRLLP